MNEVSSHVSFVGIGSERTNHSDACHHAGIAHADGNYGFTQENYLQEGAERIRQLGSDSIFIYLTPNFRTTYPDKSSGSWPAETPSYISDLIPTTNHLDLTWGMAFDLFPLETIENKKRFYARAVPEKWLVLFTHDPTIPAAYVERTPEGKMKHTPALSSSGESDARR